MNTQIKAPKFKRAEACPECGQPKSRYADMCRECYQKSGGLGPRVRDAVFGDNETPAGKESRAARLSLETPVGKSSR
jgi:hypothetical protein